LLLTANQLTAAIGACVQLAQNTPIKGFSG